MLREPPLLNAYRELIADGTKPHARGAALEALVAKLFRAARLGVEPDAGAARPRQTDLVATSAAGAMYLIEVKWRASPADISDLDSLRARLDRAPSAIGVLVSVSGFSSTVIDDLKAHRDPQVLLIDGEELEQTLAGRTDLKAMLREKEDALRVHGEVLIRSRPLSRARPRRPLGGVPAGSEAYFVLADGTTAEWIKAKGDFGQFTFTTSLTDPDWVPAWGAGVMVDIALPVHSVDGIVDALAELADLRFSTTGSHWCIQQTATNWHGTGGEGLARALRAWEARYSELGRIHHTEQVCYQDVCDDGFYTLTFDVDASSRRIVWHAALSMALTGVPLDPEPIRELCRTFKVEQPVYFRPRTERVLSRMHFDCDDPGPLQVLGSIVEHQPWDDVDPYWVGGIVVRNPFLSPDRSRDERITDSDLANYLGQTEVLVCDLSSWHPLGTACGPYRLLRCEWGWTSEALVVHVTANWDRKL
jgi:hypothetical protein